jgi:HNH endonuclease
MEGFMKFLELTQGKWAQVDDEDYAYVSQWKWYASCKGARGQYYACRTRRLGETGPRCRLLHYEVLRLRQPLAEGKVIDHINREPLDCQKDNLRICTHRENLRNQRPQRRGTSRYRGVYFHKPRRKWTAKIKYDGKARYLGLFRTEYQAMMAYNAAAMGMFKLFAYVNQWQGPTECPEGFRPQWKAYEPGVTGVMEWLVSKGCRIEGHRDRGGGAVLDYVI